MRTRSELAPIHHGTFIYHNNYPIDRSGLYRERICLPGLIMPYKSSRLLGRGCTSMEYSTKDFSQSGTMLHDLASVYWIVPNALSSNSCLRVRLSAGPRYFQPSSSDRSNLYKSIIINWRHHHDVELASRFRFRNIEFIPILSVKEWAEFFFASKILGCLQSEKGEFSGRRGAAWYFRLGGAK